MEMDFFEDNGPGVAGEVTIGEDVGVSSQSVTVKSESNTVFVRPKVVSTSIGATRKPVTITMPSSSEAPVVSSGQGLRQFAGQTLKIITPSGEQKVVTVRTAPSSGAPQPQQPANAPQHIQLVQQSGVGHNLVIRQASAAQHVVVQQQSGAGSSSGNYAGGMVVLPPGVMLPGQSAPRGRAAAAQRQLLLQASGSPVVLPAGDDGSGNLHLKSRQFNRRNMSASHSMDGGSGRQSSGFPFTTGAGNSPVSSDDEGDGPGDGFGRGRGHGANGLRKYSRNVMEKVKKKGCTTYNEVADELVQEYAIEHPMVPQDQLQYHQKNIRRRVYDALNVLMAMSIIVKEKKEIRWVGLPMNYIEECKKLEAEREDKLEKIQTKVQEVQEQVLQLIAIKNLIARNKINERLYGPPPPNQVIELPYLIVLTNKKTVIDCNIANDKMEYLFNFDQAFEIRDDIETLQRLGLCMNLDNGTSSEEEFGQCYEQVPMSLRFYVEAMYERRPPIVPDFAGIHAERKMVLEQRLAQAASGGGELSDDSDDLDVG